jgi:hypothetical protein
MQARQAGRLHRRRAFQGSPPPVGTNHRLGSNRPAWIGHDAMSIDWMQTAEISEAIPPAYNDFIARRFLMTRALYGAETAA